MAALLLGIVACNGNKQTQEVPPLTLAGNDPAKFVSDKDSTLGLFTLSNANGMSVDITNFGGRLVSIMVPDRTDSLVDVLLGFDNLKDYLTIPSDFGATIGRYANRINQGKITIDGTDYQLETNNYGHTLHGGPTGWQYQVYSVEKLGDNKLKLTIASPDGDNGFPGTVTASATYTLTDDNALDIQYEATTDKPTVINMTNHAYFNLSGDPSMSAMDHLLYINADSITPVDSTFMTTGEMVSVTGTPFDFTSPKPISQAISATDDQQIVYGHGIDHNFVLNTGGDINTLAAKLTSLKSGITLEVYTNEPGIQVYTGNFLDGTVTGKRGIAYKDRPSVCLETQHFPDSPNKPQWPSVVLRPGETYRSHCIFRFSVDR